MEEKENFAKNMWKLVKELEDLRAKCNTGECVGNALVMNDHVTETSQSLRNTAESIDQFCKDLRNNLERIQ